MSVFNLLIIPLFILVAILSPPVSYADMNEIAVSCVEDGEIVPLSYGVSFTDCTIDPGNDIDEFSFTVKKILLLWLHHLLCKQVPVYI